MSTTASFSSPLNSGSEWSIDPGVLPAELAEGEFSDDSSFIEDGPTHQSSSSVQQVDWQQVASIADTDESSASMSVDTLDTFVRRPIVPPGTTASLGDVSGGQSSGIVSMDLTVPVGAVDPASLSGDYGSDSEKDNRTVSMSLTTVEPAAVLASNQRSSREGNRRRATSERGRDVSQGTDAPARRDSSSGTEQPRTPSEGAVSFDPERSARAQSSPPIHRQSRSKASAAKLPKSGDAGVERKVSGQSTKSSHSSNFGGYIEMDRTKQENQIILLKLQLAMAKEQQAKVDDEREREREQFRAQLASVQQERKEEKGDRKAEKEEWLRERNAFDARVSKMEDKMEQERKAHQDQMEQERKAHKEELAQERKEHKEELAQERKESKEALVRERQELKADWAKDRQAYEARIAKLEDQLITAHTTRL